MFHFSDGTCDLKPSSVERFKMITRITSYLHLDAFDYKIPDRLTIIESSIYIHDYHHQLPSALTHITGDLIISKEYRHSLPESLKEIGGSLSFDSYGYPLPKTLTKIGGSFNISNYNHLLPNWILSAGRDVRGYMFAAFYQNDEWRIRAGCRDFTVEHALQHWQNNPECLALVKNLVEQIRQSPLK